MVVVSGRFGQLVNAVAYRLAEAVDTSVSVVDEQSIVVASSDPILAVGSTFDALHYPETTYFHLPVYLHGRLATVVFSRMSGGEPISPRLAETLLQLTVDQSAAVASVPDRQELKNKFIYDLLFAPIDDEQSILREGQVLGMDLTQPRAVILINAEEYISAPDLPGGTHPTDAQLQRRTDSIVASVVRYFQLPNDTICVYIGGGEVVLLKASTTRDLVQWTDQSNGHESGAQSWANLKALHRAADGLLLHLRQATNATTTIGIGRYHPSIRGLSRSYREAQTALSLGARYFGPNQVHCLDRLGIASFAGITEESTKLELASYLLSPLDHAEELIATLDAFFSEDCSPSATAHRLAIHRNTLSYRLDKIASLTGLDPRRFDDAVQIRIALLLRSQRDLPR